MSHGSVWRVVVCGDPGSDDHLHKKLEHLLRHQRGRGAWPILLTDQAAAREYARYHGYGTEALPEADGLGRADALVAFWDLSADDPVKDLVEAALGRGLPARVVPPAGPPPEADG